MPDLDTELTALGEHMRESITPPDLEAVADRARERTVRRRTQLAAIAAVFVVTAAVPLLRAVPGGDTPASDHPTSGVTSTYSVEFADADHGFAVDRQCERPGGTCRLLSTSDGGQHWSTHALPPASDDAAIVGLIALGADRVALDRLAPGIGNERIYSDDGGRTWQTVPLQDNPEPVDAIPEGGVLNIGCAGGPGQVSCSELIVTMPGNGQTRVLAHQPGIVGQVLGPVPTADGTWWVAGDDPVSGATVLSVSTDDGRTWRSTLMDVPDGRTPNTWAVVEGGGVLYAAVSGTTERTFDLVGIFRSDDGGASWTRTHRPSEELTVPGFLGTPVIRADGLLLVDGGQGTYESDSSGETFAPAHDELTGYVRWTRAGYLCDLPSSGNGFAVSTDGVEWRPFTVG